MKEAELVLTRSRNSSRRVSRFFSRKPSTCATSEIPTPNTDSTHIIPHHACVVLDTKLGIARLGCQEELVALVLVGNLSTEGFVTAAGKVTLIVKEVHDADWALDNKVQAWLIITEINLLPADVFLFIGLVTMV